MATFSTVIQVVPFFCFQAAVFGWTFKYALSSSILESYGLGVTARKKDINNYIYDNFNKRYGLKLILVDVSTLQNDVDEKENFKRHGYKVMSLVSNLQDAVVRAAFAACTCSSVSMIVLMMCELGGFMAELARAILFVITVDTLIILLTMVLPYLTMSILIDESVFPTKPRTRIIAAICYILWFYVLHKFSDLSQTFTPASTYE